MATGLIGLHGRNVMLIHILNGGLENAAIHHLCMVETSAPDHLICHLTAFQFAKVPIYYQLHEAKDKKKRIYC